MQIKKINENTLSCIISPEDLHANGFRIDDFFERKKEAVDFIRSTVAQAAVSENFDLQGEMTTMRVSVLPDHSLSLLITKETSREGAAQQIRKIAQSIMESIAAKAMEDAGLEAPATEAEAEQDPSARLLKALFPDTSEEEGESGSGQGEGAQAADVHTADTYMFSFYTVRDAMDCGKVFAQAGPVESSFYYLKEDDVYFLIVRRTERTPKGFEKLVLSANEFGELITSQEQSISFVTEHGVCIAKEHAIEMFMDVMPGLKVPKIRRPRRQAGSSAAKGEAAAPADPAQGSEPGPEA